MRTMIKFKSINAALKQSTQLLKPMTWALLAAGMLSVNACATKKTNEAPLIMATAPDAASASEAEKSVQPEFIYRYLVGEVSGQRGDIATSGAIFYDLARTERDARLAERAAKIAAYGNITNLAAPAIKLWAELDPDSTEAQQAMTEMLIATGRLEDTKP
ncbi:MAG: tetratricopeptide repeat protein, partial [Methylophilales bacterium 16-45-9]